MLACNQTAQENCLVLPEASGLPQARIRNSVQEGDAGRPARQLGFRGRIPGAVRISNCTVRYNPQLALYAMHVSIILTLYPKVVLHSKNLLQQQHFYIRFLTYHSHTLCSSSPFSDLLTNRLLLLLTILLDYVRE
jgi:hypothetical protein